MKNTIFLLIGFLLLNCGFRSDKKNSEKFSASNEIIISCSPDLYNLTTKWLEEYKLLNPDVEISAIKMQKSLKDAKANLSILSSNYSEGVPEHNWNVVVGRDVIVQIINSKNPLYQEIAASGISLDKLAMAYNDNVNVSWGTLTGKQNSNPVNIYMVDEPSVKKGITELLDLDESPIHIIEAQNGDEFVKMVGKDPHAIGICKLTTISDFDGLDGSVKLLPIDRNANGELEHVEKIYDDANVLSRGVWIGKYPDALFDNIYAVADARPINVQELAFLEWILSDGQKYLNAQGYSDLLLSERQSGIAALSETEYIFDASYQNQAGWKSFLIILISFGLIVFLGISGLLYLGNEKVDIPEPKFRPQTAFDESFIDIPIGLYYDKSHTWAFMEKDGLVRIGINDFLQHITGPLTRVKMKIVGDKVRKGKTVLSIIQNGKQLNIYAPISGVIKEQNTLLESDSSVINSSPYSEGWVYRIEPTNWLKENQFLLLGNKYKERLQDEFSRLKDFLAASVNPKSLEYAQVLQDGGALKDGILEDLGPEVWEDFQTNFIDI